MQNIIECDASLARMSFITHFKESDAIAELSCSGLNMFNQFHEDLPYGMLTATPRKRTELSVSQCSPPLGCSLISMSRHTSQKRQQISILNCTLAS